MVEYPERRAVVRALMFLGNIGLVTAISSLVLSFTDPTRRLPHLGVLLAFSAVLVALARSDRFDDLLRPFIERALERFSTLDLHDYTGLLELHGDYRVADLDVQAGDWLADKTLAELDLRSAEGVNVLSIRREDGTYVGAPSGDYRIVPGDTLVAYGREDRLQELVQRTAGDRAAHEAARAEFAAEQTEERRRDPEWESATVD